MERDGPDPAHTRLGQDADLVWFTPAKRHVVSAYAAGYSHDLLHRRSAGDPGAGRGVCAVRTEMWCARRCRTTSSCSCPAGVHVVPPEEGGLGGDVGAVGSPDPDAVVAAVARVVGAAGDARGRACGSW